MREDIDPIELSASFPRPITANAELEDLMKYVVKRLGDGTVVRIHSEQNQTFGESGSSGYETIHRVPVFPGDRKLSGSITLRSAKRVDFSLETRYDNLLRPKYIGASFDLAPGTKVKDLSKEERELITKARDLFVSYFHF